MTGLSAEAMRELAAECREDALRERDAYAGSEPARNTGAPSIGPAWDDMPLAANRAFGEA